MIITIVAYDMEYDHHSYSRADSASHFSIENFYSIEQAASYLGNSDKNYQKMDEFHILIDGFNVDDYEFTPKEYEDESYIQKLKNTNDIIKSILDMSHKIKLDKIAKIKEEEKKARMKKRLVNKKKRIAEDMAKIEREKKKLKELKAKYPDE